MSVSEGYHRGLLTTFIERWRLWKASQHINTGDSVLDLACNEGKLIEFLPPQVEYLGVDISHTAISNAQQRYPARKFLVADLADVIPTLNTQFDVIVMLAFLEHVAAPEVIVSQVSTLLKPSGRIVVTTPAPWSHQVHNVGAQLNLFSKDAAREHHTFLGKSQLTEISTGCGLRLSTFERFMFGFNQLACFTQP